MLLEKTGASDTRLQRLLLFAAAAVAAAGALFFACAIDERTATVWSGTLSLPTYTGAAMVSETEAVFSFSEPVAVENVFIASSSEGSFEAEALGDEGELASDARISLSPAPAPGVQLVLAMTVATAQGNTLSLSETLEGYNSRVPKMRINEARIVYNKPKSEFIEFEVMTAGNLSGVVIETYGYRSKSEKNTTYTFPAAEVKAGELVVLHYRLLPEDADFTDETGTDLTLSTGDGASDTGRDLWFDYGGRPFSDAGVFLLRERNGGELMDALVFSAIEDATCLSSMESAAAEAVSAGVWAGSGDFPAFDATGTTPTRTICREPKTAVASPESWYICATSNATPGEENSSKRYSPN